MAKKLLIKKPRTTDVDGRKVVLTKFEKHMVNSDNDFSTQFGIIKKSDLKKKKAKTGKEEFYVLEPSFIDYYKTIKRLAQIITLKDIGSIIANTGMNNESIVMEAGTGSAGLSSFISKIAKKVISYDINSDHIRVAKENLSNLKIKNVEIRNGNIYDSKDIREQEEIDILILDNPEPWKAIKTAEKVLKTGGFVVSYSPNINQTQKFVKALSNNFLYERTIENIEREWSIKDEVLRPRMKDIGHTAFLSFARKIQ